MKIHILADNRVKTRGFLAEHGLSVFIKHKNNNILFDTGQSDVYLKNAKVMEIDLTASDCIILSHGHYDHCGGLIHFPKTEVSPKIYAHKLAFTKRFTGSYKAYRDIGVPWSIDENETIKNNLVFNKKTCKIAPDITLCAEIPSTQAFEDVPKGFYTGDNKALDMMKDEQMLIIERDEGLVVFLGCSHPGIINCLRYALKLFPDRRIDTLVAGMHLENVSPMRLQMTIQCLMDLKINRVVPLHCTGISAISEMKHFLGSRCLALCSGDVLEI